jgi:MFS family permease
MRTIRGRAMGTYGASWGVGFASGPLVGGFLYGPIGPAGIFIVSGLISFVATFLMLLISLPQPRHQVKRIKLTGWGGHVFSGPSILRHS